MNRRNFLKIAGIAVLAPLVGIVARKTIDDEPVSDLTGIEDVFDRAAETADTTAYSIIMTADSWYRVRECWPASFIAKDEAQIKWRRDCETVNSRLNELCENLVNLGYLRWE